MMAAATVLRLSLRAEPAVPIEALEQSLPEEGAPREKQETAPPPGFSVSYSVLGQPEGQVRPGGAMLTPERAQIVSRLLCHHSGDMRRSCSHALRFLGRIWVLSHRKA